MLYRVPCEQPAMRADFSDNGGLRVATLGGELDMATFDDAEAMLLEAEQDRPPVLVLDLRELTFMDSNGLRLLLRARKRAADDGRRLVLVRGQGIVQRVLEVAGIVERFEMVSDPLEADRSGIQPTPSGES
jgi:anti-anti-sigma factor